MKSKVDASSGAGRTDLFPLVSPGDETVRGWRTTEGFWKCGIFGYVRQMFDVDADDVVSYGEERGLL